jgi:hypothetical protein
VTACRHGPPDRREGEPPSMCRACRRDRYRATSQRPRRRRDLNTTVRSYVALARPIRRRVEQYASSRHVSIACAVEDLVAIGLASELVADSLAAGDPRDQNPPAATAVGGHPAPARGAAPGPDEDRQDTR